MIIILVAIGLSIASGINKSRKKTAKPTEKPDLQPEADDPWSTIRKYIEDVRHENIPGETHMEEAQLTEVREEENPYTAKLNEYARNKSDAGRRKTSQKSRVVTPVSDEPAVEEQNAKDILEDFDLEKAVIYSEILRPKYEEF